MNIKPYFWDLSETALAETEKVLRDPADPKFAQRMVTLLSRCDKTKDIFGLIDKKRFAEAWPAIRKEWNRTGQAVDFRDWWETVYEGILGEKGRVKSPAGVAATRLRLIGERIRMSRMSKGWSQKDLANRAGLKQSDVSAIESGNNNITLKTLERLNVVLSSELIVIPPPNWPGDKLSEFIDMTERNIFYPFAHLKIVYEVFVKIDGIYDRFVMDKEAMRYRTPQEYLLRLFGFNSHSAYRAACRLALSGQVGESYLVSRGCLENALYALHVFVDPARTNILLQRNDNKESKDKCRGEFGGGSILRTLRNLDQQLHFSAEKLYERAIDLGAHPNATGILSRTTDGKERGATNFNYVVDDTPELRGVYRGALITTAEIGICSLKILEHVFKDDFVRLKFADEISAIVDAL